MGIYIKGIDSLDGFNTYITTRLPHALKYKEIPKEDMVVISSPHGRLIDVSTLNFDRPMTFGEVIWEIENAPTILEAEF